MRYFLGCDVAKVKIDVALVNEQGIGLWVDTVVNETSSIATFLLTTTGQYTTDELICVVEATGCYHHPVLEACQVAGIPCWVYNPILTRQGIRSSVRGRKTDRTDAILIGRMGLRGEGRLHVPEPYLSTKYAARAQQRLGDLAGAAQRYQVHIEQVLDDELSTAAQELLTAIQVQFKAARRQFIADTAANAPQDLMRRLQTVPGIGPYTAASIIGEVQTIELIQLVKAAHSLRRS